MDGKRVAIALAGVDEALTAFAGCVSALKVMLEELPSLAPDANPAIIKLRADLEWRGPNDRKAGHICLPREMAEQLLEWIDGNQGKL